MYPMWLKNGEALTGVDDQSLPVPWNMRFWMLSLPRFHLVRMPAVARRIGAAWQLYQWTKMCSRTMD